ncbi:Rhomboid protein 14 [Spatholobus suberectus]|nr:Rhomboid protein 14 [Spatholobus suberectus]
MEERIERIVTRGTLPLLAFRTLKVYYRSERKPSVTASLIAANTLIYLRPSFLDPFIPPIDHVRFNPHLILKRISPGLQHVIPSLERVSVGKFNEKRGFCFHGCFLACSLSGITLTLSKWWHVLFDYERAYYEEYAIGFSGVLFAMKVIPNSQSDNCTYFRRMMSIWAELFLVQKLVPGVSFIGHLGGVLAGLLYLMLRSTCSGSDPVTFLIRGIAHVVKLAFKFLRLQKRTEED